MSDAGPAAAEKLFHAALAKHQAGQLAAALEGYRAALAVAPDHGPSHSNASVVLRRLGRPDEAVASADAAIAASPREVAGHTARGRALMDLRRPSEALASYDRAVALDPGSATGHHNRAAALLALGRAGEALEALDRALTLEPGSAALHLERGVALSGLRRGAEAAEAFARAAELQPASVLAHRNLALARRELGLLDEALTSVERALALSPDDASLHDLRGGLLGRLERPAEALESFDRALARDPSLASAHNGRGRALAALDRLDEALAAYDRVAALAPEAPVGHRNRGVVLRKLRRTREAIAAQDQAIALAPQDPDAYWFRSLCHLLEHDFAAGWPDYERRWEVDEFLRTARTYMTPTLLARLQPGLEATDLKGRGVLLVGEQGVGDVVMFASIIPDLQAVAGRVALICDPRLRGLLGASFPGLELPDAPTVVKRHAEFPLVLGIASLGRLFRNRREDFPGTAYLTPRAGTVARWAERLGPAGGRRRIGVSWRGGVATTGRGARSMDLARLAPLLSLPDCEVVSLQYGDPSAEVAAVNAGLPRPIRIFPTAEIDDFDELAGLVANLDLVVSVQNSLVHLAGAVGAPALVMVPETPEWRYGASGPAMPWYGSVRLFRQEGGDWDPVIDAVTDEVRARLSV